MILLFRNQFLEIAAPSCHLLEVVVVVTSSTYAVVATAVVWQAVAMAVLLLESVFKYLACCCLWLLSKHQDKLLQLCTDMKFQNTRKSNIVDFISTIR